ncbi:MAG TPA: pre-toxin TG domain-containing protein [Acidimicrobiales bacterium]|nr:pre-toxin TG domain-containing protein [Acidimicrobiales bacterium]
MSGLTRPRVRLVLRTTQVAALAWTVLVVLFASPASADNCSVFTDCFGQANSAAETGFGLALLIGLSIILDFIPVIGDIKGVAEAITGEDLLTGEKLEPWERALGLIPLVPGAVLLRYADEVADLGRQVDGVGDLGRHVDDVEGLGRHADDLDPVVRGAGPPRANPRPSSGTPYPIDPSSGHLVDEYADATPARRAQISEQLGEEGGTSYLRDVTGDPDLGVRHGSEADLERLQLDFEAGQAWPHGVSFGGSHATNIVYFDGDTLHIIEAKGGSSPYAIRQPTDPQVGGLAQTDPNYPRVVGSEMASSVLDDGRNEIGRIIGDAYEQDIVRYVGVRTGPASALRSGDVVTTVDRVFLEP